ELGDVNRKVACTISKIVMNPWPLCGASHLIMPSTQIGGYIKVVSELIKMYHELPNEGDNKVYRGVLSDDLPTIEVEFLNYSTI
ncbi:6136_t:CDS:2, partial [Funneliformis caledonium]